MPRNRRSEKADMPPFDLGAFVASVPKRLPRVDEEAVDASRDVLYRAVEAPTDEEEQYLLLLAISIDPTNVDALRTYVRYCDFTLAEEISVLQGIVSIAERQLGKKAFREYAGEFWGFLETRPYMRARADLARDLLFANRMEEAVAEWEGMLELNPNDNQGMRYYLLTAYLNMKNLAGARRLFEQFDEFDFNTVFAYGRVLERLLAYDKAGAESALATARKQNPHSEWFLRDMRRRPKSLPAAYSPGSEEEAACYCEPLQYMWFRHLTARRWLAEQCESDAIPAKKGQVRKSRKNADDGGNTVGRT